MSDANLIEIFCILDEFCKYFTPELKKHTLDTCGKRRNRPCLMSDSEVMTILVLFHTMRHRDLKSFSFFVAKGTRSPALGRTAADALLFILCLYWYSGNSRVRRRTRALISSFFSS